MTTPPPYMPILVGKTAELDALALLTPTVRAGLLPMIRAKMPENERTTPLVAMAKLAWEEQKNNMKGLMGTWGCEAPILVDASIVAGHSVEAAAALFDRCAVAGVLAVPVAHVADSVDGQAVVAAAIQRLAQGGAIRLTMAELGDPTLPGRIDSVVSFLGVPTAQLDLVIDTGDLGAGAGMAQQLGAAVAAPLAALAPRNRWRSVTVASACFPGSLAEAYKAVGQTQGTIDVDRVELPLWTEANRVLGGMVGFGDHCMVSASTASIPRQGAANIRYAQSDTWHVLRGGPPKADPPPEAFARLAQELVAWPGFAGARHCAGCEWMADLGRRGGGGGTPWRRVAFVHHITSTVENLRPDLRAAA